MANFATHNFIAGSSVELPLVVSHYSSVVLEGSTIQWQTGDGQSGVAASGHSSCGRATVATEGTLNSKPQQVGAATPEFLRLQLVNAAGDDPGAKSLPLCRSILNRRGSPEPR